ncbi:MAG: hypothetical protein PSV40_21695, partial [Polaromonas sp.]|uniref:hypothetical protein n=1 Tax=Polaromonas sp. TaxID=1869339 RepID=UPI002487C6A3
QFYMQVTGQLGDLFSIALASSALYSSWGHGQRYLKHREGMMGHELVAPRLLSNWSYMDSPSTARGGCAASVGGPVIFTLTRKTTSVVIYVP